MLFIDYYPQYMSEHSHLRECTLTGYESVWRLHCQPLAYRDMDELTLTRVQSWVDHLPSPGVARKAWAFVRAMLRAAHREGLTTTSIDTVTPRLPQIPHYEAVTLTASQVRRLLRGCYDWHLEAWLIVSVSLGLRPEEALALEWKDINLRSGLVHITKGGQWLHGREVIVPPKTKLSRRTLVLPKYAKNRLKQLKTRGRLIGTLTVPQVARRYKQWCISHSLPYVPPESLRHTWATLALKAKIDISVVSRCLGHASIETTANHYLHPDIGIIRDAQRAFDKLITTAA